MGLIKDGCCNEAKNIQKLNKGLHWEFEEKLEEK